MTSPEYICIDLWNVSTMFEILNDFKTSDYKYHSILIYQFLPKRNRVRILVVSEACHYGFTRLDDDLLSFTVYMSIKQAPGWWKKKITWSIIHISLSTWFTHIHLVQIVTQIDVHQTGTQQMREKITWSIIHIFLST